MRELAVGELGIRGFRNLTHVDVTFGRRFNVVAGENGQGKTNLLEAVYVLATSRSFRTSRMSDLIGSGGASASLRARLQEEGEAREQSVGLQTGVRAVRVDGKRPLTLAAYAVRTPVVVFHPGMVGLAAGSGSERRKMLDRVALYLEPASLADLHGYAQASRARQRVLETRGDRASDLDEWEELMARHALGVGLARGRASELLVAAALDAFARIGAAGVSFRARYQRSAPAELEAHRTALAQHRARDRARGSAHVGPHRDDLVLELGGRPVRGIASQGQHRAVVLALELAEIAVVGSASGVRPILLLDDVSSELDRPRTTALFEALRDEQGQVILTTTRPELMDSIDSLGDEERRDFAVVGGAVQRV
jgi:DNA replication and repair protein RecF